MAHTHIGIEEFQDLIMKHPTTLQASNESALCAINPKKVKGKANEPSWSFGIVVDWEKPPSMAIK